MEPSRQSLPVLGRTTAGNREWPCYIESSLPTMSVEYGVEWFWIDVRRDAGRGGTASRPTKFDLALLIDTIDGGGICANEIEETVEHRELHFQLDAVHNGFVCRLDVEVVGVLGRKKGGIQQDRNGVDKEKVDDDLVASRAFHGENGFQACQRLPDVEAADDGLLHGEPRQLDPLVDIEWRDEAVVAEIAAEEKHGDGDV